jgi:hypothetical protein
VNWAIVKDPTILVTSAVYGLLALMVTLAGIFGIWLGVLLFFSMWRYCYAVLRAVAQGHKRIPPPDIESFNPVGEWGVFWHLILFPGLFLVGLLYRPEGLIIALAVAISFPASAVLMAITSNISHSVSPAAMIGVARILGTDYLALVLAYVAVLVGSYTLLLLLAGFSGLFALLISYVVEVWMLLASFGLIGSALRANRLHFEIPGEIVPQEDKVLSRQHEDWHRDLDNAYASFRSGIQVAGYQTLHNLVDRNGDSFEVNFWLIENMLEWDDKKYALEVAGKLMPRLLARNKNADALELYQRCRRRDAGFRLLAPQAERLAEYARSVGHTGIADELSYN